MPEPRLILRFKSSDEGALQIAIDYWREYHDGQRWQWNQTVQEVADTHGLQKKDVIVAVRSVAAAFDNSISCAACFEPRELTSRSTLTEKIYGEFLCSNCRALTAEIEERERQEEEATARSERSAHIAELTCKNLEFEYQAIDYFEAVLVYAIMVASDDACENGEFDDSSHLHLCASDSLSGKLLARLHDKGIIGFAIGTPINAMEPNENGSWSYYPHRVKWRLAKDAGGTTFPKLMTDLGNIVDSRDEYTDYYECISKLWWMLGYDDALQFLLKEVSNYQIPNFRHGPKTDEAIYHALEQLSIPQVRRGIMSVVKNAAALSLNRTIERYRALNTIPGSLIGYVDRAMSDHWQVYPVISNWNEEPVLLKLLFNRVLGTGLDGFKTFTVAR